MSNTLTALKTDNLTLEEKGKLLAVKNRQERVESLDRIGFEEDDVIFDANNGSIDNFNSKPTVDVPQYLRRDFENDDVSKLNPDASTITELFQNGAEVTFGALQKSASFLGDALGETGSALTDLGKAFVGRTEVPQAFHKAFEGEDTSKLDPTKATEEQKKQEVFIATENANAVIENATQQASQQEYEEMIKMALRLGVNVESLADKLDAPHLRKADLLRVYYLALGDSLQIAEEKITKRMRDFDGGASLEGDGRKLSTKDIDGPEKQGQTAQTATG